LLVVDQPQPGLRALLEAAGHTVTEQHDGVLDLSASADEVSLVLLQRLDPESALSALIAAQKHAKGSWVPLVVLAAGAPEARARWLDLGADEVLGLPVHPLELQARLARLLRQKDRLESLTHERERLLQLSITDALTGLYNHGHFQTRLREECRRASRYNQPLSLLILDLDHFKSINDNHGHPVGDMVLRRVSERLTQLVRETDMVARYGGEEFALLLPQTPRVGAYGVALRICQDLSANTFKHGDLALHLTVSIGMAQLAPAMSPEALVAAADEALYLAKHQGRNQVVAAPPPAGTKRFQG
jgi:diguanylate cyclase (GGDEF)-like protein